MSLTATKTIKYLGRTYDRGEVLEPEPEGRLRSLLLDGRYVQDGPASAQPAATPQQPQSQAEPEPLDKEIQSLVDENTKRELLALAEEKGVPANRKQSKPDIARRIALNEQE